MWWHYQLYGIHLERNVQEGNGVVTSTVINFECDGRVCAGVICGVTAVLSTCGFYFVYNFVDYVDGENDA